MVIPPANRDMAARVLSDLNESLWMGHFDIPRQTNIPVFRQTCLFRGAGRGDTTEHIEDLVDISLTQCERYQHLFDILSKSTQLDEQNLSLAAMETVGQS
jgi:hypothetical protein